MRADTCSFTARVLIAAAALFCQGCAAVNVSVMDSRGGFSKAEDEARLWKRAEEFRDVLLKSGYIHENEDLRDYVNRVLHKLTGSLEEANNVRLNAYVINDPFFNAFCLPNGDIFVHTAIIAEADNEAQLAALLGHEATHFLHRHVLKEYRSLLNKTAFLSVLQVTTAGLGPAGSLAQLIGEFGVAGVFYGYSRDIEREADLNALELLVQHGYPAAQARRFFEKLYDATKNDTNKVPYFYSSHPRAKERIANTARFMRERGLSDITVRADSEFETATLSALLHNAELSLRANKNAAAELQARKYERIRPGQARPQWILARALLAQGNKDAALAAFKETLSRDAEFAEAYRDIGMLHYKEGKAELARPYFQDYLRLKPDAPDAAYIKEYAG